MSGVLGTNRLKQNWAVMMYIVIIDEVVHDGRCQKNPASVKKSFMPFLPTSTFKIGRCVAPHDLVKSTQWRPLHYDEETFGCRGSEAVASFQFL